MIEFDETTETTGAEGSPETSQPYHVEQRFDVRTVARPYSRERMLELTEDLRGAAGLRNSRHADWENCKEETARAKKSFESAEEQMLGVIRKITRRTEDVERRVIVRMDYVNHWVTVFDDDDGEVYEDRAMTDEEAHAQAELDLGFDEPAPVVRLSLVAGEPVEDAEFEDVSAEELPSCWCEACGGTGEFGAGEFGEGLVTCRKCRGTGLSIQPESNREADHAD